MIHATVDLDDLDRKIIDTLITDGRISIPALAERVGTSRATAYSRFDRLVESGVITGFHASVDQEKVGRPVTALTLVSTNQTTWREVANRLAKVDGVTWLGLSVGTTDFAVLLRAESLEHLRDSVLEGVVAIGGVTAVDTRVILDEIVPNAGAGPSGVGLRAS